MEIQAGGRPGTVAVILAMFGTSVAEALPALLNIRARMASAFPAATVQFGFSSGILRRIWHGRAGDRDYRAAHPEIPGEVYDVGAPQDIVADLARQGYEAIVVQPIYMTPGDEYRDLLDAVTRASDKNLTEAARSVVGRPALGLFETGPPAGELEAVAWALTADIEYARKKRAALLYMGHGGIEAPQVTDRVYTAFAETMAGLFPEILVLVATVEDGGLGLDTALVRLREQGVSRLVLKPFMIVAGNHVRRDMIGYGPRGWKGRLEKEGFSVDPVLTGLGEMDTFADIFVRHAADAAAEAGIQLS